MEKPKLYLHAVGFLLLGSMSLFGSIEPAHNDTIGEHGEQAHSAPVHNVPDTIASDASKMTGNENGGEKKTDIKSPDTPAQDGSEPNPSEAPEATGPADVTIGIYLFNIRDVNSGRGTFTSDLCIWSQSPDIDNIIGELQFANAEKIVWSVEGKPEVNGLACVKRSGTGVFRMTWDFKDYPYDTQKLRILINYTLKDASRVILVPDLESSGISKENIPNGWMFKGFSMKSVKLVFNSNLGDPNLGTGKSEFSGLETTIDIERKDSSEYWMMTIVAYSTSLLFMISFFIDTTNTSRLGMLAAAFIACVISLRTSLGVMGVFGTSVDRVHLLVLGYITFAVICTAILTYLVHHKVSAQKIRFYSMVVGTLTAVSFLLMIWFFHAAKVF